jgi:hypothetical protein
MATIPSVNFIEQASSTQPIQTGVRNRVLVIGEFDRGPLGPTYIGGASDFAVRYGADPTNNGSLGVQAILDQGAVNIAALRVIGNEKRAYGQFNITGVATSAPGTNYDSQQLSLLASTIGNVVPNLNTVLRTNIEASGRYTGSTSSVYNFYVATNFNSTAVTGYVLKAAVGSSPAVTVNIPANSWLLTYVNNAPDAGQLSSSDFVGATNYILVTAPSNLASAPLSVATTVYGVNATYPTPTSGGIDGLGLTLGFSIQTSLDLVQGQIFSVTASNFNSLFTPIKVVPNTTNEVLFNLIQSNWQNTGPIGNISLASSSYSNGYIYASNSYPGQYGNNLSYSLKFAVPDGTVEASVTSTYTAATGNTAASYTLTLANTSLTQYIRPGATVSDGGTNININAPTVTSINSATGVITLSGGLTASISTAFAVTFTNTSGLSIAQVNVNNNGFSTFTSGIDGPKYATRDLYNIQGVKLITLIAVSPGIWANDLSISITNTSNPGQFIINIVDNNANNFNPPLNAESFIVNISNFSQTDGSLIDLNGSNYIRGFFVPYLTNGTNYTASLIYDWPQRLLPPIASISDPLDLANPVNYGKTILTNFNLQKGSNGPIVQNSDYYAAIDQAYKIPVHILVTPGVTDIGVQSALIAHCEASTELEQLRVCILQAPRFLKPEQAKAITSSLSSARAVMVVGWGTYRGSALDYGNYNLSLDSVLAGRLSALPFYVNTAARRSSGPIGSIYACDTDPYATYSQLQVYAAANLEVVARDPSTQGYYFFTGASLSPSPDLNHISYRRAYDIVRMDLYDNLQTYKSEPLTSTLVTLVTGAINAYMNNKLNSGQIAYFNNSSTSVNAGNTPNTLAVSFSFAPLGSADSITVYIQRDASGQFINSSST